jgi:hypothetical protein
MRTSMQPKAAILYGSGTPVQVRTKRPTLYLGYCAHGDDPVLLIYSGPIGIRIDTVDALRPQSV